MDTEVTDKELLQRFAAKRSQAAFAELVRRHGPTVHGVCRRVLQNNAEAEDAAQETFLVLARKHQELSSPERLAGWLYGVAYRTSLTASRKRSREQHKREQAMKQWQVDSEGSESLQALRGIIDDAVAGLPKDNRDAIVAFYLEGQSYEEAAQTLNVSENRVRWLLQKAREGLRSRLGVIVGTSIAASQLDAVLESLERVPFPESLINSLAARACQCAAPAAGLMVIFASTKGKVLMGIAAAATVALIISWNDKDASLASASLTSPDDAPQANMSPTVSDADTSDAIPDDSGLASFLAPELKPTFRKFVQGLLSAYGASSLQEEQEALENIGVHLTQGELRKAHQLMLDMDSEDYFDAVAEVWVTAVPQEAIGLIWEIKKNSDEVDTGNFLKAYRYWLNQDADAALRYAQTHFADEPELMESIQAEADFIESPISEAERVKGNSSELSRLAEKWPLKHLELGLKWGMGLPFREQSRFLPMLLKRMALHQPEQAKDWLPTVEAAENGKRWVTFIAYGLSANDPETAAGYVPKIKNGIEDRIVQRVAYAYAEQDPDKAIRWLNSLEDEHYANALGPILAALPQDQWQANINALLEQSDNINTLALIQASEHMAHRNRQFAGDMLIYLVESQPMAKGTDRHAVDTRDAIDKAREELIIAYTYIDGPEAGIDWIVKAPYSEQEQRIDDIGKIIKMHPQQKETIAAHLQNYVWTDSQKAQIDAVLARSQN